VLTERYRAGLDRTAGGGYPHMSILALARFRRGRVPADDQQADQNCADQRENSYVEARVKGLIACSGSEQTGGSADGAEGEIEFFHPSPGIDQQPQENRRDDGEDSAQNPCAGSHRRGEPDSRGGSGGHHLAHRNQQEDDGVNQRHDGALAVGKNGKSAHT